jgi:raffinose/stachyose/melibiose transport system substrate-binding protein
LLRIDNTRSIWFSKTEARRYRVPIAKIATGSNFWKKETRLTKKWFAAALVAGLTIALSACASDTSTTPPSPAPSANGSDCETTTEFTWFGTIKVEIRDQFLAAIDEYNASQDCYEAVVIEGTRDETFLSQIVPLYERNDAPTIMTALQELPDMAPRVMDWTGTDLANLAAPGSLDGANIGGKQVGIPVTAEAFGLLYNKAVLDEAGVDPEAIKTRSDLEAAFQAVEATGRDALHFSGLWWSLGAHFTNIYHTTAAENLEGKLAVLDGLSEGTKSLLDDPKYVEWLDTFDLLKDYSTDSASIADSDYDLGVENLGEGEVGFWFMGNWAEPNLLQTDADGSFGVMPVPVSDSANAYGNDSISVGVPFYIMIDAEQSTEEEREGAMDLLRWFLTTPEGQARWAGPIEEDGMNFIPMYEGFTVSPSTFMSQDIANYIAAGKTLDWINSYYPAGLQDVYGKEAAQPYYDRIGDRAAFARTMERAWAGADKTWR